MLLQYSKETGLHGVKGVAYPGYQVLKKDTFRIVPMQFWEPKLSSLALQYRYLTNLTSFSSKRTGKNGGNSVSRDYNPKSDNELSPEDER